MTEQTFSDFGLAEPLLRALNAQHFTTPTPIQARAIPQLLEGRDMLGLAQTGTGKTAAFALPVLQLLLGSGEKRKPNAPRALILAPTRELVVQIADNLRAFSRYTHLKHATIVGGLSMKPQTEALRRGVDILVATTGRLLDHMRQGHLTLKNVKLLVLDEADRMFDMGFIKDIEKIVEELPAERQSMMFSATMAPEIEKLARRLLNKPERIDILPPQRTADKIDQCVYFVSKADKRDWLGKLLEDPSFERVMIFTRTKHMANRVSEYLEKSGIPSGAIHGNKSQSARQKALNAFRHGQIRALVATDVAARGIDVDDVTHVINFELPNEPESYVHRIGRTARAGREGQALSFCDASENGYLRDIEKLINMEIPVAGGEMQPDQPPPRQGGGHGRKQGGAGAGAGGKPGRRKPGRTGGAPGRASHKPGTSHASNARKRVGNKKDGPNVSAFNGDFKKKAHRGKRGTKRRMPAES